MGQPDFDALKEKFKYLIEDSAIWKKEAEQEYISEMANVQINKTSDWIFELGISYKGL